MMPPASAEYLPLRSAWRFRLFRWYVTRYVRRHVHAVRLSRTSSALPPPGEPVLVVLNHPAWWDPLICTLLTRQFAATQLHFAAIAAEALDRYRLFRRLGFFGVEAGTLRGATNFLRIGETVLSNPNHILWVTAQGRFVDVRTRPLDLHAGVGHLAARLTRGTIVPIALEYTFWTERTPEALVRVGPPLTIGAAQSGKEWTQRIEDALTATLDGLNREAMTRDPAQFTTLLGGAAGIGGVYDSWRRLTAWFRGERFDPTHDSPRGQS